MTAKHWKDNVFFERLPNGDMKITKTMGGFQIFDLVVPGREWCSIFATFAAEPGAATYREVEKLYFGK